MSSDYLKFQFHRLADPPPPPFIIKDTVKSKGHPSILHPLVSELYTTEDDIPLDTDRRSIFYRMGYSHAVDKHGMSKATDWNLISEEEWDSYVIGYEDGKNDLKEWLQTPPQSDIIQP